MSKPVNQITVRDVAQSMGPGKAVCTCCCSCLGFILIMMFFPATVHQLGQKQYGLARNKVTGVVDLETVYVPGRYWLGFWKEFIEFPSTLNTIEFSDEAPEENVQHLNILVSRDQDGKRIYLDVSLQYLLKRDEIGQLYKDMMTYYEDVYVSVLRDALTKAGNDFAIDQAWANYSTVNDLMKKACLVALDPLHAICWDLQLWRIRLDSRYEAALIRTQVRKQAQRTEEARKTHAIVRAQTQVFLANYTKNVTIILAGGEADKYKLEQAAKANAEALTISANAEMLQTIMDGLVVNKTSQKLNKSQAVEYQKVFMLQSQPQAHVVYHSEGGEMDAKDALAATQAAGGGSRRLLLRNPTMPYEL